MMVPARNWQQTKIKPAREEKRKYDRIRLAYDAAIAANKSLKAKPNVSEARMLESEQMVEEKRAAFEQVSFSSLECLETTNDQTECAMMELMCKFVEAHCEMFKKGHELFAAYMPKLEFYKRHMENKKEEMKQKQADRYLQRERNYRKSKTPPTFTRTQIFGMPLELILQRDGGTIPKIVEQCLYYVEKYAMDTIGVFRISGNQVQIRNLIGRINNGEIINFEKEGTDCHIVTGILKTFLAELPEPLLTHQSYQRCISLSKEEDTEKQLKGIAALFHELPPANLSLLQRLLYSLHSISLQHTKNLMSSDNLATVIAPNILYNDSVSAAEMLNGIAAANSLVDCMITGFPLLFPDYTPPCPSVISSSSPSSVQPPHNDPSDEQANSPATKHRNHCPKPVSFSPSSSSPETRHKHRRRYSDGVHDDKDPAFSPSPFTATRTEDSLGDDEASGARQQCSQCTVAPSSVKTRRIAPPPLPKRGLPLAFASQSAPSTSLPSWENVRPSSLELKAMLSGSPPTSPKATLHRQASLILEDDKRKLLHSTNKEKHQGEAHHDSEDQNGETVRGEEPTVLVEASSIPENEALPKRKMMAHRNSVDKPKQPPVVEHKKGGWSVARPTHQSSTSTDDTGGDDPLVTTVAASSSSVGVTESK
ncbi:Rho GTPase-activating protein 44 [Balamuthia mandrillaris]